MPPARSGSWKRPRFHQFQLYKDPQPSPDWQVPALRPEPQEKWGSASQQSLTRRQVQSTCRRVPSYERGFVPFFLSSSYLLVMKIWRLSFSRLRAIHAISTWLSLLQAWWSSFFLPPTILPYFQYKIQLPDFEKSGNCFKLKSIISFYLEACFKQSSTPPLNPFKLMLTEAMVSV